MSSPSATLQGRQSSRDAYNRANNQLDRRGTLQSDLSMLMDLFLPYEELVRLGKINPASAPRTVYGDQMVSGRPASKGSGSPYLERVKNAQDQALYDAGGPPGGFYDVLSPGQSYFGKMLLGFENSIAEGDPLYAQYRD